MIKKTSLLSLTVLALAMFTVSLAPAQASGPTQIEKFPFEEELWNPCADEWVRLQGTLQVVSRSVEDENGGEHFSVHVTPQNIVGEGLSTGAEYRFSGVVNEVVNWSWPPTDRPETVTSIDQHRFIAKGTSENTVMQEMFHFTINVNGELTGFRYEFQLKCQ